jgi:hypothetical protein
MYIPHLNKIYFKQVVSTIHECICPLSRSGHFNFVCDGNRLKGGWCAPLTLTSQSSVARCQKFRPKSSKGAAEKKKLAERICGQIWLNLTKKWQKRGRRNFSKEVPYF